MARMLMPVHFEVSKLPILAAIDISDTVTYESTFDC